MHGAAAPADDGGTRGDRRPRCVPGLPAEERTEQGGFDRKAVWGAAGFIPAAVSGERQAACRLLQETTSPLPAQPGVGQGWRCREGAGRAALGAELLPLAHGSGGECVTMVNPFSAAVKNCGPLQRIRSSPGLQAVLGYLTSLGLLRRNSRCTKLCRVIGSGYLAPSAL